MTRLEFITKLKAGLTGLAETTSAEVIADYEAHFSEGLQAGRSESEIAESLGDPARLSKELRAEAGLKQWEDKKTPSSAISAMFALLGLGAIDIIFLLPLILGIAGALAGFFMASFGVFIAGGAVFAVGPFSDWPGGFWAMALAGLALMALAVVMFSLTLICAIWLVNFLIWFGRLHYKLVGPALNPQTV